MSEEILDEKDCEQCQSTDECKCGGNCDCGGECHCHDGERCNQECDCENHEHQCHCGHNRGEEYLELARRVQADFENFRRHAIEDIKKARIDGQVSVIEAFLPCLDIFKEAKKSISDENVLKGVEMVENKIIESLSALGVEKIQSIGNVYNPHYHNVIAVVKDESKDSDIILDEYQAGYIFNDKVIRYAKVIVNKKEEN